MHYYKYFQELNMDNRPRAYGIANEFPEESVTIAKDRLDQIITKDAEPSKKSKASNLNQFQVIPLASITIKKEDNLENMDWIM